MQLQPFDQFNTCFIDLMSSPRLIFCCVLNTIFQTFKVYSYVLFVLQMIYFRSYFFRILNCYGKQMLSVVLAYYTKFMLHNIIIQVFSLPVCSEWGTVTSCIKINRNLKCNIGLTIHPQQHAIRGFSGHTSCTAGQPPGVAAVGAQDDQIFRATPVTWRDVEWWRQMLCIPWNRGHRLASPLTGDD